MSWKIINNELSEWRLIQFRIDQDNAMAELLAGDELKLLFYNEVVNATMHQPITMRVRARA